MRLNTNQIAQLRVFVINKGFVHLDVQMEILDHLASAVEEHLETYPNATLNDAITKTHQSFGVMGFSVIEDAVVKTLQKKYARLFWQNFWSMFKFPYVFLMLIGGCLTFNTQLLLGIKVIYYVFIAAILTLCAILYHINFSSRQLEKYKAYHISGVYLSITGSFLVFINYFLSQNNEKFLFGLNQNILISSLAIQLFIVYIIAAIQTARKGISDTKELMKKFQMANV